MQPEVPKKIVGIFLENKDPCMGLGFRLPKNLVGILLEYRDPGMGLGFRV